MELSEALRIIEDTVGMFQTFEEIIEFGDLKKSFISSPVKCSMENYVDFEKQVAGMQYRKYYTYIENGIEHKNYIVDIHPVCSFMIDEWPLPIAKKIFRLLKQDLIHCIDYCQQIYGEDNWELNIPLEDNYNYQRKYVSSNATLTIEDVMFDTIHEMSHAIGVVEMIDEISEKTKSEKDSIITEKSAREMDWVRLTDMFNLEKIREVAKNTGKSNEEKRIVVKAIYDVLMSVDKLYNVPYDVDKLIMHLYSEYGGNIQDLSPSKTKITKKTAIVSSKIPKEIAESEDWEKLLKAGIINENGQPNLSRTETAILTDILLERMGKTHKWTLFENIWEINNMRIDFQTAQNLVKYNLVRNKILRILH